MKSPSSHSFDRSRINGMLPLADAAALIRGGAALAIAGRPAALAALPPGRWIGGSTPYFMTDQGGAIVDDGQVFVTDFSWAAEVSVSSFAADSLERISGEAPDHGFALVIIPAGSECHTRFATEAASYPQAFLKPTVGWIAGVDLADPAARACVYDGRTGTMHEDRAVALHVTLADGALAQLGIVNLFAPDNGDVIHFEEASFSPRHCIVGGERILFSDYVRRRGRADGSLPLVGDFGGAHVNASLRSVEEDEATLYAPVFPGVDYRFAAPIGDYAESFRAKLAAVPHDDTLFACNCILNFLFGELEGKAIGGVAGPITFGEIAYQLLNQTFVYARIV